MHRRYTVQAYRGFIERACAVVPELGLGTDVMVGFPGETDEAFQNTVALLSALPFAYFHVFSFSKRPGTAAARMHDAVPSSATVKRRSRMLADLSRAKRLAYYQRQIGRNVNVLFEEKDEAGTWTGLT